jgi:all-trans-8'-apo-beta-carotenal 15,15'-oxygenase
MIDNFAWMPHEGTEVVLVELDPPHRITRFRAPASLDIHLGNAYEDGEGRVVVDCIRHHGPDIFTRGGPLRGPGGFFRRPMPPYGAVRATIDPRRKTITTRPLWSTPCEFPAIDPRRGGERHRHLYVLVHDQAGARENIPPSFGVAKLDPESGAVEVGALPHGCYASDPVFVPRPGGERDDDGWLLTLVYDCERHLSHVAVLDAAALARGPIARAWFDHHIPPPFHSTWVSR